MRKDTTQHTVAHDSTRQDSTAQYTQNCGESRSTHQHRTSPQNTAEHTAGRSHRGKQGAAQHEQHSTAPHDTRRTTRQGTTQHSTLHQEPQKAAHGNAAPQCNKQGGTAGQPQTPQGTTHKPGGGGQQQATKTVEQGLTGAQKQKSTDRRGGNQRRGDETSEIQTGEGAAAAGCGTRQRAANSGAGTRRREENKEERVAGREHPQNTNQ